MRISFACCLLISLIYLIEFVKCGYIQSWDIETLEDYDGNPNGFKLHFNLQSGLSMNEYIQITFPDTIAVINSDLYLFENTLLLVSGVNYVSIAAPPLKNFFFNYGITLKADMWYTIVLNVDSTTPINWSTFHIEPVEMFTVSDSCNLIVNCSPIIYDMNNYFGYLLRTRGIALGTTIIKITYDTTNNA